MNIPSLDQGRSKRRLLQGLAAAAILVVTALGLLLLVPQTSHWLRRTSSLANRGSVPRLVEFRAPWCPACARMAPRIEQLRRECANHDIEILEVDVSDERNQELARQLQIMGVPSIGLLRPDGTLQGKLIGEQPLSALRSAADDLGAGCSGGDPEPAPSQTGATCGSGLNGGGGAPASCGM